MNGMVGATLLSLYAVASYIHFAAAFTIDLPPRQYASALHSSCTNNIASWQDNPVTADLPILDTLEDIFESLRHRPNLLLEAPPGAGKTTIIPLALLKQLSTALSSSEASSVNILVVEPRRVAVRSAARRMADLWGESVGQTVGYAIRGESRQSKQTRITVVTDGVLLNMMRQDPELAGVDAVILDEFHERGVGSDTALALCRETQKLLRPDLTIIVMSATLLGDENSEAYSNLMTAMGGESNCRVIQSQGRQYPVDVVWPDGLSWKSTPYLPLGRIMKDRKELVSAMCNAIEQAVPRSHGDILVFLPGAAEIRRVVQRLQEAPGAWVRNFDVLPLYGALPREQQDKAIAPSSRRRIIVSSPIAEASLTIEGVTCVVDSGLRREPRCDVDTGMPRLVTTVCSQASATQRAGRAGRMEPGVCVRIYGEVEFESRFPEHSAPEIQSTDLSPTVLLLANWGCADQNEILDDMSFVDAPDKASLEKAVQLLVDLQCLEERKDDKLIVTAIGRTISQMPTHPRFATTLVRGSRNRCHLAGAIAVAYLLDDEEGGGPASRNPIIMERVKELYQQQSMPKSFLRYASRMKAEASVQAVIDGTLPLSDVLKQLGLAVLPGFGDLIAQRKGDASYGGSTYLLSLGRSARLDDLNDPSLKYLVVLDTSTSDDGTTRIRSFVPIAEDDLEKVAIEKQVLYCVPSKGYEVRAKQVRQVGSLELSSSPLPAPSGDQVAELLRQVIRKLGGAYVALGKNNPQHQRLETLLNRLELARYVSLSEGTSGLEDWPDWIVDRRAMDVLLEPWWDSGSIRSLKDLNLLTIVESSLNTPTLQKALEAYPERIQAPDGTSIPLVYQPIEDLQEGTPNEESQPISVMAKAKLQQFFGCTETPTVGSSIPVQLQLLSPAGRLLAQTKDLPFFWQEVYPSVRAEMKGKYPKHPWPDEPMAAVATRQTNKQLRNIVGDDTAPGRDQKRAKGGKDKRKRRK